MIFQCFIRGSRQHVRMQIGKNGCEISSVSSHYSNNRKCTNGIWMFQEINRH